MLIDDIIKGKEFDAGTWVVFHDLKRKPEYNNMIGIITGFKDNKAKVQIWQKHKIVLIDTKNLQHLNLHESYSKNGHLSASKNESGLDSRKSSKYIRLVNFIENILKVKQSSPILIGDNPLQHWNSIEYWTIPCTAECGKLFIR